MTEVKAVRRSVELSAWPDLVVIYLGFRVTRLRGLATVLGLGRGINAIARDMPDGLLAHEFLFFGLTHIGMRQYWRDLESLERFTKAEPPPHLVARISARQWRVGVLARAVSGQWWHGGDLYRHA